MANIKDALENIKQAVYGKQIRSSIYDAIYKINNQVEVTTTNQNNLEGVFDQLIINAGNSNAEVVTSRIDKPNSKTYPSLGDRLNAHSGAINTLNEYLNSDTQTVVIKDDETIQDAINRASAMNSTLELKPKAYKITNTLTIDISKCSLKGNGATLDFTNSNVSVGIRIISNAATPYLNNGRYISGIEMIGSGMTSSQVAIQFDSTSPSKATSHINLEKLNIHEFGTGIRYRTYCYLIRHESVDIFNCNTCVDMPSGGLDYGENVNFYGCAFYNSEIAVKGANSDGAFHFTSCSIDYCNYFFQITNSQKCFFVNGHLEGHGIIKGNVNIDDSWLYVTRPSGEIFDVSDARIINITNCFLNTPLIGKQLVYGNGRVNFENCRHYLTSDFVTNDLNSESSSINAKYIDLHAIDGTDDNINKLTRSNCIIKQDMSVKETGNHSYKITKQYGPGSNSMFRILIPRKTNSTRFKLIIRMKAEESISGSSLDVNLRTINTLGCNENGVSYWSDYVQIGNYKPSLTTAWSDLVFYNNIGDLINNDKYIAVDFNLFNYNANGKSMWIDSVKVFEY